MIRISKLADYAVVILAEMSHAPATQSAASLAVAVGLAEPTVAKVLKILSKAELVTASRGATGGYQIARAAAQITAADIITAVDGPIGIVECTTGHESDCAFEKSCRMQANWGIVNTTIRSALTAVTLADMMQRAPAKVEFA